jgi:hypothetical protein
MYEDESGGTAKPYEHHDEGFLVDLEMQDHDGTDCAPPGASVAGWRVGDFLHASVGAVPRSRSRPSCRESATQTYEYLARRPSTDH